MITKLAGKLVRVLESAAIIECGDFEYEVLIPDFTRRQISGSVGQRISLHTIQYMEGTAMGGRMIPRLIGFANEAEREFFDLFCSVDGVGVKKALRAMVRPVQDVATMIERQEARQLSALPGVGPATAERIIAKLRRKVPKFALLVTKQAAGEPHQPDMVSEAFDALVSLGHSESDARRLVERAMAEHPKVKDVEGLIHAVYKLSR